MLRGGIGSAADFLLAEIPGVGALELVSGLLSLGYPENQVLKFLSGPGSYLLEKL
jgi:hypothetical protein